MADPTLLMSFPAARSGSPDVLPNLLAPAFTVRSLDLPDRGRTFGCVVNQHHSPTLTLSYARYGSPIRLEIEVATPSFWLQGFPLTGAGRVTLEGHEIAVRGPGTGIILGPGSEATLEYDGDFSHLVVTVSTETLARKLSALLDEPVDPALRLANDPAPDARGLGSLSRLSTFLAEEIDRSGDSLPALFLEEMEDAVVVGFLFSNHHNYSSRLAGPATPALHHQVRLATEYIEEYWDGPITVDTLASVTGTSVRNLFHLFRKTHGVSPMVYVRRLRLRHARGLLLDPGSAFNVTAIAGLCGFSNPGYFARAYYQSFGELPSETLQQRGTAHSLTA